MIDEIKDAVCVFAKSLFDRGFTHGSTGNISVRLDDGSMLVTPTGSSLGSLAQEELAHVSKDGELLSGLAPTKEMPLQQSFHELHGSKLGAVIHLHSHYAVALSVLNDVNPEDMLLVGSTI